MNSRGLEAAATGSFGSGERRPQGAAALMGGDRMGRHSKRSSSTKWPHRRATGWGRGGAGQRRHGEAAALSRASGGPRLWVAAAVGRGGSGDRW